MDLQESAEAIVPGIDVTPGKGRTGNEGIEAVSSSGRRGEQKTPYGACLPEEAINLVVGSRKGYWRIANTLQLNQAMGIACWRYLGLLSLEHRYLELRSVS